MTRRGLCGAVLLTLVAAGSALPAGAQTPEPSTGGVSALGRILEKGGKWSRADRDAVRRLLRSGESIRTRSPHGVTVLMFAARAGDLALMRAALKGGVNVNARTRDGATALWYVMTSRDEEKVRLLLDAGADTEAADSYGRTPLMMATNFKFRGGINLLLARGARINARNHKGHTVLAYTDGHPGITQLLRQHGAVE